MGRVRHGVHWLLKIVYEKCNKTRILEILGANFGKFYGLGVHWLLVLAGPLGFPVITIQRCNWIKVKFEKLGRTFKYRFTTIFKAVDLKWNVTSECKAAVIQSLTTQAFEGPCQSFAENCQLYKSKIFPAFLHQKIDICRQQSMAEQFHQCY